MNNLKRCGILILITTSLVLRLDAQTISEEKLVGKWRMNIAKSQFQNVPQPTEGTLVVFNASPSHFKWHVSTAFTKRGRTVWNDLGFDGAIDGKPYKYKDAPTDTKVSFIYNNGAIESTAIASNGGTEHETITVSPDGNTMTAQCTFNSVTHTSAWTEIWERVPYKKRK